MTEEETTIDAMLEYSRDCARVLQNLLFLRHWTIRVVYDATVDHDAQSEVNNAHLRCTIKLGQDYLECWKRDDKRELRDTLIHEFCHILVQPMDDQMQNIRNRSNDLDLTRVCEQVVCHLTKIFMQTGWIQDSRETEDVTLCNP